MRKLPVVWIAAFAAVAVRAQDFEPGEVLVKFRPGNTLAAVAARQALGARTVELLPEIGVQRLELRRGASVQATVAAWRRLPFVEFAEPNYRVHADTTPNDPQFDPRQAYLRKIRCEQAWDITQGISEVVIAIVDTGIDLDHPDLAAKLVPGYDVKNNDPNPDDDHGHGTHCAGLAAAITNNGVGIAGVAWNCRLMPVKALDSRGAGSSSNIAAGINYAVSHGANVISLSLGTKTYSATMDAAVQNAVANNVVVVAAAGNDNSQQVQYPGALTPAIAVAAVTDQDTRASFSNYGSWVDVAAPGVNIYSTWRNGYRYDSGTSMATPMVAGLAGLLWSQMGFKATNLDVRARIEENTIPIGTWVVHGRIDVERALLNLGPPEEVRRSEPPDEETADLGIVLGGNLSSLAASDDDRLELMAAPAGSGRQASVWAKASPQWSGQRIGLEAKVEASTSPGGIVRIAFWNWNTSQWSERVASSLGTVDRSLTATTSNPDAYVGPGGEVRVRVYRTESRNRLFRLRVDRVEIVSVSLD